jgi:hypothetical protein
LLNMSTRGVQSFNADKSEAYRGSTLEATKRHQRFEPAVSKAVFVCVRVCVCVCAQRLPVSACVRGHACVACVCERVCARLRVCMPAWCVPACVPACLCVWARACERMRACVGVRERVCVQRACACVHAWCLRAATNSMLTHPGI